MMRVSPLKPGLRGSQNWMAAKVRAAKHSPRAMVRFMVRMIATFLVLIFIALWLGGFLPAISNKMNAWKVERLMAMGFVVEQVKRRATGSRACLGLTELLYVDFGPIELSFKSLKQRLTHFGKMRERCFS